MAKSLQEQANEILEQAERRGVSSNFFFVTTFKRYQVQMKILSDLEKAIGEYGATVTKEYVKGRQNLVDTSKGLAKAQNFEAAHSSGMLLMVVFAAFAGKIFWPSCSQKSHCFLI